MRWEASRARDARDKFVDVILTKLSYSFEGREIKRLIERTKQRQNISEGCAKGKEETSEQKILIVP